MTQRLLAYVAASCFAAYVVLTAIELAPSWAGLSLAESFVLVRSLLVLAGIAAVLCWRPRVGCWAAVAWGVIVPFEKYLLLVSEILAGTLVQSETFAATDICRLVLLFAGTCLSALLAYQLHGAKNGKSEHVAQ